MPKNLLSFLSVIAMLAYAPAYASSHGNEHVDAHADTHAEKHGDAHADSHADPHPAVSEHAAPEHKANKPGFFSKIFKPFVEFYTEFDRKLGEIQHLDENNERLKARVAKLEVENKRLAAQVDDKKETARANLYKGLAKHEGGVPHARTIASLEDHAGILSKPPKMIYQYALKAFAAADYESSAKAFVQLAENEENTTYQTAEVYYFAGVSLYHVGNYKIAEKYFTKVMKDTGAGEVGHVGTESHGIQKAGYASRAMAWLSLCKSRVGDPKSARKVASELIQRYPKSREARRLNRDENFE